MNPQIRQSANSTIIDQIGKPIPLPHHPLRIVSLVPSQTELLCDLGLDDEVVGITKFCIHPDSWFRTKVRVGGTKKVHIDKVRSLEPNLVLANKEENRQEDVRSIEEFCPVWTSDISTIENAMDMIRQIGAITAKVERATTLISEITETFGKLSFTTTYRSAFLIWKEPWMAAGGNTFINDMLKASGLENVLENRPRYPVVQLPELILLKPEIILLSSEPYPFKNKNLEELHKVFSEAKIVLANGEFFSWYGSRMLQAPEYFRSLRREFEQR